MDRSTVVQVDATIITGMLILLSVSSIIEDWQSESKLNLPSYFFDPLYKVVIIIIPFSLSAASECMRSYLSSIRKHKKNEKYASPFGLATMFCGFVALIILLASHAVIRFAFH